MKKLSTMLVLAGLLPALVSPAEAAEVGKMTKVKRSALEWMDKLKPELAEAAIYIWEHPELSFVEFKSAAKLQTYLEKYGFTIETGIAGIETAFIASRGSGPPVIGFNGEYDALPNLSQEPGVAEEKPIVRGAPGHGCGHHLFGATTATAAIATAMAMKEHGIPGTVRFYGTPGEEAGGGKAYMARDGAWDDCDACISWHPGSSNAVKYGSNQSVLNVKVRFHGRSAHAAGMPHLGRSALDGVELLNIGMNFAREHLPDKTRVHYVITSGGEAPNNVPPLAEVWYFLRASRWETVEEMYEWMRDIAEGAALMSRTTVEFDVIDALMEILPNRALAEVGATNMELIGPPPFDDEDQAFGASMAEALTKEGIEDLEPPHFVTELTKPETDATFPDVKVSMGSSDDGNVSWVVPMVLFSGATWIKGTIGHNWSTVSQGTAPSAIKGGLTAGKWMAATALDLFRDPEVLAEAKEEFQGYLEKWPFTHPLPEDAVPATFYEIYGRNWEDIPKPPTFKKK